MSYFEEGNICYNSKNYKKAIDLYNLAIKNKDNEASSFYNSAVCHIKLKDFNTAMTMLKKAIMIRQESKYFFNLAYCHTMKKNYDKALMYFNLAWALDNEDNECEKALNMIISQHVKK